MGWDFIKLGEGPQFLSCFDSGTLDTMSRGCKWHWVLWN